MSPNRTAKVTACASQTLFACQGVCQAEMCDRHRHQLALSVAGGRSICLIYRAGCLSFHDSRTADSFPFLYKMTRWYSHKLRIAVGLGVLLFAIPAQKKPALSPHLKAGLLLFAALFVAYLPALTGAFLWDDNAWVDRIANLVRDGSGLWAIWFEPGSMQQYYPLTATTYWVDYHLWGNWTLPYHLENLLLHAAAAWLFFRVLCCLEIPGALLAAAIFALHPVMVESVAWITERKNVLSLVLSLGAFLAYGRFARLWEEVPAKKRKKSKPPVSKAYRNALLLFVAAMSAKATAFVFPAAVLLICWWKKGRIGWREDVRPLMPFFAVSLVLGLLMSWVERHYVGAEGAPWQYSFPERCLIAGRALCFYVGKLVWPADLSFIYSSPQPDPASVLQWACVAAALAVPTGLWLGRGRLGRGPFTAVCFFAGTLVPVLGFLNVYGMRYAFVWDHWVYLPSLGVIALTAAGIHRAQTVFPSPRAAQAVAVALLAALALLTWRQSRMYTDVETLWRTTLERNPDAFIAHNNLALMLAERGQTDAAEPHYRAAITLKPDSYEAHDGLGSIMAKRGQAKEAERAFRQALSIKPSYAYAHYNLANLLTAHDRLSEAIEHYRAAVKLHPDNPGFRNNLAGALFKAQQLDAAADQFREAIRLAPDAAMFYVNLATILIAKKKYTEAARELEAALARDPTLTDARMQLNAIQKALRSPR